MKDISVSDVKREIEKREGDVANFIWNLIKPKRTRKQTIFAINSLTREEIEAYLARWKLERSIEYENR